MCAARGHERSATVVEMEESRLEIPESDTVTRRARLVRETDAVVFDGQDEIGPFEMRSDVDSSDSVRRAGVTDCVLHERLQRESGHEHFVRARVDVEPDVELVAEPELFDRDVLLQQFDLVAERKALGCTLPE
jgi:hypothetical protein